MQILPVDPLNPAPESLEQAVELLRAGQLVVIPTETVYGLAGLAGLDGIEEKIYRAKHREPGKPLAFFVDSLEQVEACGAKPGRLGRALAQKFWPGPLTLVIPGGKGYIGFRIPDHPVPRQLLRQLGQAMVVTSANESGAEDTVTAKAAAQALGDQVGMVLDAGKSQHGVPSTVVKIIDEKVEILRVGAIGESEIRRIVQAGK